MISFASLFASPGYNASYPLLAAVWLQAMGAGSRGMMASLGVLDNVCPRDTVANMEKSGKYKPDDIAKLKRLEAAQTNCIESLGIFAASVVAGNVAGLPAAYMNKMVLGYLGLRFLYVYLYATTTYTPKSLLRSGTWVACQLCWITTLFKAGSILNGNL